MDEDKLIRIAKTYLERRDRIKHPDGYFDGPGRWYPSERELRKCCENIRRPSRRYPYSLMVHCRTLKHICNLYGVEYNKEIKEKVSVVIKNMNIIDKC